MKPADRARLTNKSSWRQGSEAGGLDVTVVRIARRSGPPPAPEQKAVGPRAAQPFWVVRKGSFRGTQPSMVVQNFL